jgi:hypothetical protein
MNEDSFNDVELVVEMQKVHVLTLKHIQHIHQHELCNIN